VLKEFLLRYIFIILFFTTLLCGSVDWQTNYHSALNKAQDENKRIYLLIVSDDCRWCRKFKKITLKDKKILKKLDEKYILLILNRDKNYIPNKFKTSPIPRHYFLTSNGEIVYPIVGYRDVEMFSDFIKNANDRYERRDK
jgi:thioredoxin-related protein